MVFTAGQRPTSTFSTTLPTKAKLLIASLHLVLCLPCFLLPSLGCQSITLIVHLLFVLPMTDFFSIVVQQMFSTLVCSLIHEDFFLSFHILWQALFSPFPFGHWNFVHNCNPYLRTRKMMMYYCMSKLHSKIDILLQIIPLVSDRALLGSQLVLLAGQRLHHHLATSTNAAHHQALTSPSITEWLKSLVSWCQYMTKFCSLLSFNSLVWLVISSPAQMENNA